MHWRETCYVVSVLLYTHATLLIFSSLPVIKADVYLDCPLVPSCVYSCTHLLLSLFHQLSLAYTTWSPLSKSPLENAQWLEHDRELWAQSRVSPPGPPWAGPSPPWGGPPPLPRPRNPPPRPLKPPRRPMPLPRMPISCVTRKRCEPPRPRNVLPRLMPRIGLRLGSTVS